jgi:hypothetical protein
MLKSEWQASNACTNKAGLLSLVLSVGSCVVAAAIAGVCATHANSLPSSTRVRGLITAVKTGTKRVRFPDAIVTPRIVRKRTRKGAKDTYSTVYDVTNFISDNGGVLNSLRGLSQRPPSDWYPVRLNNGRIDGGTVISPFVTNWNSCITTVKHEKFGHSNVLRLHNDQCETLLDTHSDVYLFDNGGVKSDNSEALMKGVLQVVAIMGTIECVYDMIKIALLLNNNFYNNYRLPSFFEAGMWGPAGEKYAEWWYRAYAADAATNCVTFLGFLARWFGVTKLVPGNVLQTSERMAKTVATTVEKVSDNMALAALQRITKTKATRRTVGSDTHIRHIADTTNLSTDAWWLFLQRRCLIVVTGFAVFVCLKQYLFTRTLKVEKGTARPLSDWIVVTVFACVIAVRYREITLSAHTTYIRQQFRNKLRMSKDFFADETLHAFSAFDHARIAI